MKASEAGLDRVREWLDGHPVRYAHVLHLLPSETGEAEVRLDDNDRPRSVLTFHPGKERLAAASQEAEHLRPLLDALPSGTYRLSSIELDLIPILAEAMEVTLRSPVWLFRMRGEDLRPLRIADTEPVREADAAMIAQHWAPDRDATDYVRRRILEGISSGVYLEGELVAWDMTHFETDKVVMLGFLHVKEAYRGRGYGKTVTTSTVEKVFAKGKIPAAEVFEDNAPSMRLTEGMGFTKVRRGAWGSGVKA